ncbi:DUF1617 family protein [Clostridium sp. 1001271B_151109_B4]|uniref:DUF1617 family protein n=1 Tax=Clostridium sp. 1001271B_151109_B4 TaxID=2787148 RepID=UPI0018A98488|nr:DUF1617 family protein [Clostridium sp. 1001271B_151109_B4]
MKLTLSNEKIVNTINVLGDLNNAKLPVKVAYAITKNINKINSDLKAYNEEKAKLIDKYAEKDKEGKLKTDEYGNVTLKEEYIQEWNRDMAELLSIENEIDIHMIQLDDLLSSDYSISPAELAAIDFMIND